MKDETRATSRDPQAVAEAGQAALSLHEAIRVKNKSLDACFKELHASIGGLIGRGQHLASESRSVLTESARRQAVEAARQVVT